MKKQEKNEAYIKATEDSSEKEEGKRVMDIAKILEKNLNVNHFLNTRFNRQNITLCEKLMKEQEPNKNNVPPKNLDDSVSFIDKK